MDGNSTSLSKAEHERVLQDEILTRKEFRSATRMEQPKIIILAGQPGAGKSGLKARAELELGGNMVSIDPDALRDAHPDVERFRKLHPYTWADDTHPDASAWAKELRAAAIDGRKNIILDTTLADGDKAVALVKELQAKGYQVEVRAVAAHRLESELGVDGRFSRLVDEKGYGRYVPEQIREQVYRDLPATLNKVAAETGVPIQLFDRSGTPVYDNRTDPRLPGVALDEAREARLKDPNITRNLRDGWREQQTWHQELPENLPKNPHVDAQTAGRLLAERADGKVVESVERGLKEAVEVDYGTRVRPARISGGTALGVAGIALTLYDAAQTGATVSRHYGNGNATAAESELVHFGARSVGGFAGFGLGFMAGAAAGVESGPGLFVTGLIGGVAGTFAGDELAAWTDKRKILNQELYGNVWSLDPDKPSEGWVRQAPLDRSNDGVNNARSGDVRASPATANQLNFQATTVSAELVLGSPPRPQDPFTQPANASDMESFSRADWQRDTNGKWHREVQIGFVERGMTPTTMEIADPKRAAELDRAAAQVLLQNVANTPAAIATRYEEAYARNGWAAYGTMPQAVQNARSDVDTLIASDGDRYQRNANGQWDRKDTMFASVATGNLREELEATRSVLQATLPPPLKIEAPQPMTEEMRLRDTIAGAYANARMTPSPAQIEASALAVRQTWNANGLDPNTTALQLQSDGSIASMRLESDGRTYRIAAVTSKDDIDRAQQTVKPATPEAQAPKQSGANPTGSQNTQQLGALDSPNEPTSLMLKTRNGYAFTLTPIDDNRTRVASLNGEVSRELPMGIRNAEALNNTDMYATLFSKLGVPAAEQARTAPVRDRQVDQPRMTV